MANIRSITVKSTGGNLTDFTFWSTQYIDICVDKNWHRICNMYTMTSVRNMFNKTQNSQGKNSNQSHFVRRLDVAVAVRVAQKVMLYSNDHIQCANDTNGWFEEN